jgi:ABC-type histidine transport system ATPase subunit
MLETAGIEYPMIHLFDEPQFNTQDGYIGFMLEFFQKLRREGRLVFVCLHPNEPFQLEIMREICERYIFVQHGKVSEVPDFESLISHNDAKTYLGSLLTQAA